MHSIFTQAGLAPGTFNLVLYGVGAVVLLVVGILVINFGMIYIRALFSGAKVTVTELIALRLRRIPLGLIVDGRITAVKSGLPVSIDERAIGLLRDHRTVRQAFVASLVFGPPKAFESRRL